MKCLFTLFLCFIFIACSTNKVIPPEEEQTVQQLKALAIEDGQLVNSDKEPVQLRGISLFWSQWQPQYYNEETVENLVEGWNINLIRAAMAVEHEGYLENPEKEMQKVEKVIKAAIEEGIYVIVDWHDHHAEDHLEESKEFFSEIARKYGEYPNLIYEIYNEPLDVSWSNTLKPYHTGVIDAIREYDSDNVIVVGTPQWSQRVDLAAKDPIDRENIAYTLHFYAGTHQEELRAKAREAMNAGLALFVTEFGTTNADGDGPVYEKETEDWFNFMNEHNLSWANWSIADKDESSAALLPGTLPSEINNEENISESGKLVRSQLLQE